MKHLEGFRYTVVEANDDPKETVLRVARTEVEQLDKFMAD